MGNIFRTVVFISILIWIETVVSFGEAFAQESDCTGAGKIINAINYDGLNTTKRRVVDRQLNLMVGDVLDCSALRRSSQAILDLGLFKKVDASTVIETDGVAVNFSVIEKRYLLILPHLGTSDSGSISYGVRGNWSNIAGLNQRATLKIRNKDFNSDLKDSEKKAVMSFFSPQIRNSDIDGRIDFGYIDLSTRALNAPLDAESFSEVYRYSSIGLSRWFHQEQRQHGWRLGSTLRWRAWETRDPLLAGLQDSDQSHLGLEFSIGYNKIHDLTYSLDGYSFNYRVEPTVALNGERNPTMQELFGVWHKPTGKREYSEFEVRGGLGWSNGAYADFVPFQNSLRGKLRGYSYDDFEGDRYYYLKAAYLTPYTFKPLNRTRLAAYPSLRAEFFVEASDIYFQDGQRDLKGVAWSVGTGVRWRIPFLVGLQVGAGLAYHSEEEAIAFYISGR